MKDFKSLPIPEQWDELWEYGNHIAGIVTLEGNYTLYSLHSFYVDVFSHPISNRVIDNHAFVDGDRLEKYIDDFDVII